MIGAGFIGTHLVRHLRACGAPVRVLTRSPVPGSAPAGLLAAEVIVNDASVQGPSPRPWTASITSSIALAG